MASIRLELTQLRAWRLYRGVSQGELSKATGVAVATISRIENGHGRVNYETAAKLAAGLNVSRERLLHEAPPESQP